MTRKQNILFSILIAAMLLLCASFAYRNIYLLGVCEAIILPVTGILIAINLKKS